MLQVNTQLVLQISHPMGRSTARVWPQKIPESREGDSFCLGLRVILALAAAILNQGLNLSSISILKKMTPSK